MTLRLAVPIRLDAIAEAQSAIEAWVEAEGLPPAIGYRASLVAEELLANLVMHGRFAGEAPPARLALDRTTDGARLVLEDAAEPFDPREAPAAPVPTLDDDRVGGMGLALVRTMAAGLAYGAAAEGWNRTTVTLSPG